VQGGGDSLIYIPCPFWEISPQNALKHVSFCIFTLLYHSKWWKNKFPSLPMFFDQDSLHFAIAMSPHEIWDLPKFLRKKAKTCIKKLYMDSTSLTDSKIISYLKISQVLNTPSQFLWSIPFFRMIRFHVGTLLY
jgi:hypothetical protein